MSSTSLLLSPDTEVTCPKCSAVYTLGQAFATHALDALRAASAQSLDALRDTERLAAERHAQQLAAEKGKVAQHEVAAVKQMMQQQNEAHVKALAEMRALTERALTPQLDAVKQQLADSRAAELILRNEKTAIEDRAAALEVEVARKVDAARGELQAKVRAQEHEKSALREAEYQKTIADMREQITQAQRKADQGSQQLQGEVLELAIEDGLRRAFPFDTIDEVKKGVRGGDVIQRISTRMGQAAGILLWETKRAKDWGPQWISKLKEDMRGCGAEVGVLVTMPGAVPKDWETGQLFGLREDVWVTDWSAALQLAEVLRAGVLEVHKQRLISAGKGEKMEAVYDYLTSAQFGQKLKAVYNSFRVLQDDLAKERAAAEQRFARREKQIATGVRELLGFAGDVQGLSQQEMPQLELEHVEQTGGAA